MTASGNETRLAAAALLRGEEFEGPHLVVTDGTGAGRRIPLGERQTVGRGRETDLQLDDDGASRLHARLSRDGERWVAEDLGSKNGLRINGRRCRRPRRLRPGDELTIGSTRLVLAQGSSRREASRLAPAAPPAARRSHGRTALLAAAALVLLALALFAIPG